MVATEDRQPKTAQLSASVRQTADEERRAPWYPWESMNERDPSRPPPDQVADSDWGVAACPEAQADGVPCPSASSDCETCSRASREIEETDGYEEETP